MEVNGEAAVSGFEGTLHFEATIVHDFQAQGASFTHTHDGDFLKDGVGNPIGGNSPGERIEVSLRLTPVAKDGATLSQAMRSSAWLPPYTWVELKNMSESGYNGVYIYVKGIQCDMSEGYASYTLPVVRFLKKTADQMKALSTKRTLIL